LSQTAAPPESEPPRFSLIPGQGSNPLPYIAGVVVLAGLSAALLFWQKKPSPAAPVVPAATATAAAIVEAMAEAAPPPPPEEDEIDEEVKEPKRSAKSGVGLKGACSNCGKGIPSAGLRKAVARSSSLARGCYNRALRTGGAQGSLTVSVRIGSHGGVCGASISADSLGNPAISQCVLAKFRGRSYPKPEKGCVVVNVPLAFKMK
jgi:hypothetical protein